MKVRIGNYKNWFGPYQLAEKLCFWAKPVKDEHGFKDKPEWVRNFGEWLAFGSVKPEPKPGDVYDFSDDRPKTVLFKFLLWLERFKERKIKVKIDKWDTWNMQDTLGYIIRPMLKQLQEQKHGAPFVDPEDVPVGLRPKKLTKKERDEGKTDNTHFNRWDYVLQEMIFAFESLPGGDNADWESQFFTGDIDWQWKKLDDGMSQMVEGPNHTSVFDKDGYNEYNKRVQNGFRLFGKYYTNLWD